MTSASSSLGGGGQQPAEQAEPGSNRQRRRRRRRRALQPQQPQQPQPQPQATSAAHSALARPELLPGALRCFEREMLRRAAPKVRLARECVGQLHSPLAMKVSRVSGRNLEARRGRPDDAAPGSTEEVMARLRACGVGAWCGAEFDALLRDALGGAVSSAPTAIYELRMADSSRARKPA